MTADLYVRKSTADRGKSAADQEAECRDDAAHEGIEVGRVFADPDRSASRYARKPRPGYAELLDHIRSGECDMVMLWESSRGSRDAEEWFPLLGLCRERGTLIRVVTHRRTYDMRNRRDWRTLAEEGIDSHDESEKIAERTQRGKRIAARDGKPAGQLLFGYMRRYDERGRYVEQIEHPENAPIVRTIVERVAKNETVLSVSRDTGIQPSEVRRMVRNPGYIGMRVHQGAIIGPAAWPAIVDEGKWRTANAILDDPDRRTSRGQELQYLLSGVAICGDPECPGWPAAPSKRGRRTRLAGPGHLRAIGRDRHGVRRYRCEVCGRSSVAADDLEKLIEGAVRGRLRRKDARDLFTRPDDAPALAAARAMERELRARLQAHYAEAAAGRLSAPGLAAVEASLLPEIEGAAVRVRELSTPPALSTLADVNVGKVWATLDIRMRREVVRALCDVVIVPASRGSAIEDRVRKPIWR